MNMIRKQRLCNVSLLVCILKAQYTLTLPIPETKNVTGFAGWSDVLKEFTIAVSTATWFDAFRECENIDQSLVTSSAVGAPFRYVRNHLFLYFPELIGQPIWTGFQKPNLDGLWYKGNKCGKAVPRSAYNTFANDSSTERQCVLLNTTVNHEVIDFTWYGASCHERHSFLCSKTVDTGYLNEYVGMARLSEEDLTGITTFPNSSPEDCQTKCNNYINYYCTFNSSTGVCVQYQREIKQLPFEFVLSYVGNDTISYVKSQNNQVVRLPISVTDASYHYSDLPCYTGPLPTTVPSETTPLVTTTADATTSGITTPEATTTPDVTTKPETITPDIITTPETTPEATTIPDVTTTPDITTPDVTTTPETITPDITTTPETTPEATTAPDVTTTPDITIPDITTTPEITTPEATTIQDVTTTPDITIPDITTTPEITTPEATTIQDVTTTPDITIPDITTTTTTETITPDMTTTPDTTPEITTTQKVTTTAPRTTTNAATTEVYIPTEATTLEASTTPTIINPSSDAETSTVTVESGVTNTLYITSEQLEQVVVNIKEANTIDIKTLSSYRNKLMCAQDNRPSAKAIGYIGGVFLVLFFGLIFVSDIPKITKDIKSIYRLRLSPDPATLHDQEQRKVKKRLELSFRRKSV